MTQSGAEGQPERTLAIVEVVLSGKIQGILDRLIGTETRLIELHQRVDKHIDDLWTFSRTGQEEIREIIRDHARKDDAAMSEIRTQLLMRVPAWALAVMTIGSSIIGALAMLVLQGHK